MKIKRIRMKILMAMLLTTGIPITILAGIILYQVSQTIRNDAEQAQSRISQDMKSQIEDYNQDLYDTAYRVYYNFDLLESLRRGADYQPDNSRNYDTLRDTRDLFWGMYYNSKLKDILGIYLVNSKGESAGSFFSYIPVSFSGLDPKYLNSLMDMMEQSSEQGPLLVYHRQSFYEQPIYQYLHPLNYRGKRVGLLVIDIQGTSLQQRIEKYNTYYKGQVILTNALQVIVYHTDVNQINAKLEDSSLAPGSKLVTTNFEKLGWKLLYTYMINPSLLFFRNVAIAVIILAFILMIGFSLTLSFGITKPIVLLHRNMARIQLGDYTARTDVLTQDEIGFLGNQFNQMAEQIEQLIDHDLKLQLVNKEVQIKALQAQISPHFLHNTLQTMSSIAMIQNAPDVKIICQCLSNMYRYNMNIEEEWVTLREEIRHIRNYLYIINKRYPEILRINIRLEEALQTVYVPKLILQPIIENAIDHGLIPSRKSKKILKVYVREDRGENKLRIYIIDNGAGMPPSVKDLLNKTSDSIGLHNVQTRLKLLCGKDFGLRLLSKEGKGTIVVIELPLREEVTDVRKGVAR
ncbi:two-component system sensor histidine kinase YesM [Paenibacillus sp. V4I9]|uniref:sensor histidine kinase n=1 Tax=Paenibacillus sp. V4I9 TaxID=3042308 RepID=UPI00278677C6|nr:histidine kinase [Paenibacillus sp. V4I9]MDQ0885588.1 two-component system sensor histidine kinase YesM [Paenibacillus sp. V4I9]